MSSLHRFIAIYVLLAGALALHAWYYFPYLSDTALVSLRYSMRLASGDGLTWTDGERLEGYDNFLWIVLHAAGGAVAGFVPSARALGFAGVLLAIACVGLEPRGPGVSLPRLVVGGVLALATAPIVIAGLSGLEQGLVAGLLALALRLLERSAWSPSPSPWAPGIILAFLVLLRADGVFLVLALLAGSACLPRPSLGSLRRAAITAIPVAVAIAAGLVFRLSYYGKWLPSPALAPNGVAYVAGGIASAAMLLLFAVGATVLAIRRGERSGLVLPWVVVVSTTATIAIAGGDGSAGFHELVPALVALCFIAADEVAADWSRIVSQRALLLPMLALCAFLHGTQSAETAENRRAKAETRTASDVEVGRTLGSAFGGKRPLLAVDRPGALPFGSKLASLDFSGWQTPAPSARKPDLVMFGEASKPEHPASISLMRSKDFKGEHDAIAVASPDGAEREIWIRREGKLGIVRTPDRIDVPGHLFSSKESRASARLDRAGHLVTELTARKPGLLVELTLPPGRWRLEAPASAPKLALDVRCNDLSMQPTGSSSAEHVFFVATTKPVSIVIAPPAGARGFDLQNVTLTRVTDARPASLCARAGLPLRIPEAELLRELPEGAHWTHPSHVMFGGAGLMIEIGQRAEIRRIELSVTRNDGYTLELRRDGEVVWTKLLERDRERGNPLQNNVFDLPTPAAGGQFELFVKPRRGDARCGIGHIAVR